MERYRVKVHKKGIVVIPKEVRDKLGIRDGDFLELVVEGDRVTVEKPKTLLDLFGIDGELGVELARQLMEERRREVEKEIRH